MRFLLVVPLVACTVPAETDTSGDTGGGDSAADSGDTGADTADSDTGDTDSGDTDTADTDTGDTDTGDTDTADTDTGEVDYLAGTWAGTLHLDVTEGGFVVNSGSCDAALTVSIPEDETQVPAGTGSLTCTTGTTSDATWTLVGESLDGGTWTGTATVTVSGWPSGTVPFSGRAERGTIALAVESGGMTEGDWSYDWAASSVTLFRE